MRAMLADPTAHSPISPTAPGPDAAHRILEHVFGYPAFRGEQQQIVEHVAAGGDALVLMPTGGGKSLCYQIPALLRHGTAIVVSPLIALMQDQVSALVEAGVNAAFLNSSLDAERARLAHVQLAFLRGVHHQRDGGGLGVGLDGLHGLEAVHAGHEVIHEDHVGPLLVQVLERLFGRFGGVHRHAVLLEHAAQDHPRRP